MRLIINRRLVGRAASPTKTGRDEKMATEDLMAAARPDAERYSPTAISLHWTIAALIVVAGVLGLLHDSWPRTTQAFWINIHALVGLAILVLVLVRLWWRMKRPPPALPADAGALSRRLSFPVHALIYVLFFALPAFGIATFIWHGRALDLGLFKIAFGVKSNRAIFHPTEDVHGYLAYALFALAGLHALAALWHHFVRRDGVLLRMWPAGR
jgi:cytochrome b561